jgi:hypothetical protein
MSSWLPSVLERRGVGLLRSFSYKTVEQITRELALRRSRTPAAAVAGPAIGDDV